jgi:SAM-dependent methyltransferase
MPTVLPMSRLQVHTWCGDIVDLAATIAPLGSVDAVLFKSSFAHMHDQHEALWACCRMLRPGGHIVISHPLGRWEWHQQ